MKNLFFFFAILSSLFCSAQRQTITIRQSIPMPLDDFINVGKKNVVPIFIQDSTKGNIAHFSGSGVLIANPLTSRWFILTCDHVLKIQDSTGKFIKYADNSFATFNLDTDSTKTFVLKSVYQDSIADISLLEYFPKEAVYHFTNLTMPFSMLTGTENRRDGETVFYSGFPMALGIGKKNYPLSRTGMISQIVKEYPYILINGFVQGGYSGSPVYAVYSIRNGWEFGIIGIIQSYKNDYEEIYATKDGKKGEKEDRLAKGNSGLTYVIKMDKVIEILQTKFGFPK